MKYTILLLSFLIGTIGTFAQIKKSDEKKILKIVGADFSKLESKSSYPFGVHDEPCMVDTSTTIKGDTTGLTYKNEYVLFRDFIHFEKENELYSLLKPTAVSVGEYASFKEYVRDSIARVKIVVGIDEDDEAFKFLKIPKKIRNSGRGLADLRTDERSFSYLDYQLNWDEELSYTETYYVPLLTELYLPKNERFRKYRDFDERRFLYTYYEFLPFSKSREQFTKEKDFVAAAIQEKAMISFNIPVMNDIPLWARKAKHNNDELAILSQLYEDIDPNEIAVGVIGTQAQAFCNWKQDVLQKEMDKCKLPYRIRVTLPVPDQIKRSASLATNLVIPEKDYSELWRITKANYNEFREYVIDSIKREVLYQGVKKDQDANCFIQYRSRYFSEADLEFVDFDESRRDENREVFPLNFKTKINKNYLVDNSCVSDIRKLESSDAFLEYRYLSVLPIVKATEPKYRLNLNGFYQAIKHTVTDSIYGDERTLTRLTFEKNDIRNELNFGHGVRLIKYLNAYMKEHRVSLQLPKDALAGDPNSLVSDLSYKQALAYYNWKYPIDKFDPRKDDWRSFIYPSQEQFRKIQNGESVVIPEHAVELPTPTFRYVVHVYTK